LLTWHGILRSTLSDLHQVDETALALLEATLDGFLGILGEIFVLNDEVVKIVTEVVRTGGATVAVEYTKEADLRPFDVEVLLALWLQDV
jgi:hypothetical protein